ncbi:MAG: PD40 domain-containing protein [Acidobacteria bacterium]|nr:PD40 domain-containing protein [Acidobacteriota bacterium]
MRYFAIVLATGAVAAFGLFSNGEEPATPGPAATSASPKPLELPGESHLKNLRQLTFGGENAEAYFSADGRNLILQSTRDGHACDAEYLVSVDGGEAVMVSNGKGRTTCGYFFPDGTRIMYASTHLSGDACPPPPDHSKGYTWALYPSFDIFTAKLDGSDIRPLTTTPGYDAECVMDWAGTKILFTSMRDGDPELYVMNPDGTRQKRLTHSKGYDGGAFFSYDGSKIVYRAWHPIDGPEATEYDSLIAQNLVRPGHMELFVMNADGSDNRQITSNGAANFGPYFMPDGKRVIFASNMNDPQKRNFDLYLIGIDGSGLERVTYNETFDAFPMVSRDGKKIVFASNRNNAEPHETNIFVGDWID